MHKQNPDQTQKESHPGVIAQIVCLAFEFNFELTKLFLVAHGEELYTRHDARLDAMRGEDM